MLAALSAFEREIIKERVVAGIQNAKANGKKLGRPRLNLEQEVRALRVSGYTFRQIQSKLKISPGTVAKYLKSLSI